MIWETKKSPPKGQWTTGTQIIRQINQIMIIEVITTVDGSEIPSNHLHDMYKTF